jgi:hypothetical protein
VQPHVRDRRADGDALVLARRAPPRCDLDAGLRGAVCIREHGVAGPRGDERRRQLLAADDDRAQAFRGQREQRPEHPGRRVEQRDPVTLHQLAHPHGIDDVVGCDDGDAAGDERQQQLEQRRIEREPRGDERARRRVDVPALDAGDDRVRERAVRNRDRLRRTCRTRGEEDVGEVLGGGARAGSAAFPVRRRGEVEGLGLRSERGAFRVGQHDAHARVGEHEPEPLVRVRRVEREVRRPGLPDAEQGRHGVRPPRRADADHVVDADARAPERMRHGVCAAAQLAVRQLLVAADERWRRRRAGGATLEELDHRRVGQLDLRAGEGARLAGRGELPEPRVRIADHLLEQPLVRARELSGGRVGDDRAVVVEAQVVAVGGRPDAERERVVALLVCGERARGEAALLTAAGPSEREVLEHEQALEEGRPRRQVGVPVQVDERRIFVLARV